MRILTLMILAAFATQAQNSQADPPKRTLIDSNQNLKRPAPVAEPVKATSGRQSPESARNPGSSALDALSSSTENLNVIRDSNVRKLTNDGCAPETSARINELRTRLGIAVPSAAASKNAGSETAALAVASGWFKAPSDGAPVASAAEKKRSARFRSSGSRQGRKTGGGARAGRRRFAVGTGPPARLLFGRETLEGVCHVSNFVSNFPVSGDCGLAHSPKIRRLLLRRQWKRRHRRLRW